VLTHDDDIEKTTFRTHQGLFVFLVMSFRLTNVSATFHALMNEVLQPFLCKFVLMFFDDILIYNSSWAEHLHGPEQGSGHPRLAAATHGPGSAGFLGTRRLLSSLHLGLWHNCDAPDMHPLAPFSAPSPQPRFCSSLTLIKTSLLSVTHHE
jgi:hypothetical protein